MKCPRDGAVMTFTDDGTHMRNRCPGCSGLLLDEAEVAAALGQGRKRSGAIGPERIAALPQGRLPCPRDGKPMRVLDHQGVEIDLCADCGSLWLDAGELEKIGARGGKAVRTRNVAGAAAAALAGGAVIAAASSPAQASAMGGIASAVGGVVAEGAIDVALEFVGEALGALVGGILS